MGEIVVYALFAIVLIGLTVAGMVWAAGPTPPRRLWVAGAILLWIGGIVFMTVRPGSGLGMRLNLVPVVVDGPGSAFDALLNIAVFVPLGMLLFAWGWRLVVVVAAALTMSLSIEIAQYVTNWGRTADVNDLITNTVGAVVGWAVVWGIRRIRSTHTNS